MRICKDSEHRPQHDALSAIASSDLFHQYKRPPDGESREVCRPDSDHRPQRDALSAQDLP